MQTRGKREGINAYEKGSKHLKPNPKAKNGGESFSQGQWSGKLAARFKTIETREGFRNSDKRNNEHQQAHGLKVKKKGGQKAPFGDIRKGRRGSQ